MANVVASVVGGEPMRLDDVNTVSDVLDAMELEEGYVCMRNGEPAGLDTLLNDEDFISLSRPVKGGI